MRLADFVGQDAELYVEESGIIGLVGLGGFEGLGETMFWWRQGEPYQTAGVSLDLGANSELPPPAAGKIIDLLGLPVRRGVNVAELISIFGTPETNESGRLGTRWLRFVCGGPEKYLFGCLVDDNCGLVDFFMARKDYCDENDSI